jgi:hypothetical protein
MLNASSHFLNWHQLSPEPPANRYLQTCKHMHAGISEEATPWFAAVPPGIRDLLSQFPLRPRRLAASVPIGQRLDRLVIREIESANDPTADAKRAQVASLSGNGRINASKKGPRTGHATWS